MPARICNLARTHESGLCKCEQAGQLRPARLVVGHRATFAEITCERRDLAQRADGAARGARRTALRGNPFFAAAALVTVLLACFAQTAGASKLRIWQPVQVDAASTATPDASPSDNFVKLLGPTALPSRSPAPTPVAHESVPSCCPVGSLASACGIASVQTALFRHLTFIGDSVSPSPRPWWDCQGLPRIRTLLLCDAEHLWVAPSIRETAFWS